MSKPPSAARLARPRGTLAAVAAGAAGATLLVIAAPPAARAQLAVLRGATASPFDAQPGRRFPAPSFAGDVARGYRSADDAAAWSATLRGLVQLRPRSGRVALVAEAANAMTANAYNATGLNPRGTSWEEDVRLAARVHAVDVALGVFFRCRHEVDGATPVDERPHVPAQPIKARIVSTKGAALQLATRELAVAPRVRVRLAAGADRFVAQEDWRVPFTTSGPDWARATGQTSAVLRLSVAASRWAEPYVRAWESTTYFRPAGVAADDTTGARGTPRRGTGTRVETGVRLGTTGGRVDLFAARERLFDDLSHPAPTASRVLAIGVRFGSGAYF